MGLNLSVGACGLSCLGLTRPWGGRNSILQSWTLADGSVPTWKQIKYPTQFLVKGQKGLGRNVRGKFPGMELWVTSHLGTGGFVCSLYSLSHERRFLYELGELQQSRQQVEGKAGFTFQMEPEIFLQPWNQWKMKGGVTKSKGDPLPFLKGGPYGSGIFPLKVPDFRNKFNWLRSKTGLHLLVLEPETTCCRRPRRIEKRPFHCSIENKLRVEPRDCQTCQKKNFRRRLPLQVGYDNGYHLDNNHHM